MHCTPFNITRPTQVIDGRRAGSAGYLPMAQTGRMADGADPREEHVRYGPKAVG